MAKKISAKDVRTMVNTAQTQSSSGPTGACIVVRYQPRSHVACYEITKGACQRVQDLLGDDGHVRFMGPGSKCST